MNQAAKEKRKQGKFSFVALFFNQLRVIIIMKVAFERLFTSRLRAKSELGTE